MMHPGAWSYLLQPPSNPDPKLPCLTIYLFQPWPPLPHGPGCEKASPRHTYTYGAAFPPQGSEVGLQEKLPDFQRECAGAVEDPPPEALNASPKLLATEAGPDDRLQV